MPPTLELLVQRLAQHSPGRIELPPREQAAVALIFAPAPNAPGLEFLLIERAIRSGDPWSGHMALPGGRRDPSDADLCATAVRETHEETGIDLCAAQLLGRLDDLRPIRQSERTLAVRPFVYALTAQPALTLSEEVAHAVWTPLALLAANARESSVEHRGTNLRVPSYVIDGRVVWGMTQRVLSGLLELLDQTR